RPVPAPQTVLLTKVREGARDFGVTAGVTDARLVFQPVDVAVARACATVLEFPQTCCDALFNLPCAE
ncbi:MAG: hypothetical protein ACREV1_15605, partial [Gammaproteobacteria bacterium]